MSAGNAVAHLERWLGSTKGALIAPESAAEPRVALPPSEVEKVRERYDSRGSNAHPCNWPGWADWYDWALVWRYWHGMAEGLRKPYLLEQYELMRLGRHLTQQQLAQRLGLPERTICRWRSQ